MKENDYILANMLNPDFNNQDFKEILDMNMENTQMLPYSSYVSNPYITLNLLFQNNEGNFSELKFKDFYKSSVEKFSTFNEDNPLLDNFEYSIFDTSRKKDSRIKDPNFKLNIISNPDKITTGISGRNKNIESTLSKSELALQSKIWDTEKNEWRDYSPNDMSLIKNPIGWFKSLFDDPLVKATYDSSGEHKDPFTNRIVHHEKGDLKINDEGQYYYETLGDRSPIGKEILSSFDILTVDGEGINKYDFIDSDGLDKSVTRTIAKTALTVAPLFFGGPVSAIYSGALIAREMAKSLPMLYGMISSLYGNEEDSKTLNNIAAFANKFTSGTSEYSRLNTFTFENIASLLGDVATLYGQQQLIARSINNLRGSNKILTEALKKAYAYYNLEAQKINQNAISALLRQEMKGLSPLQYIGNPEKWQESALGAAALRKFVEPALKIAKRNMRLGADASLAYMAIVSNTDVYQSMLEHGASKRDAALVAFGSTLGMFSVDRFLNLGDLFFDELRNDARLAMRNSITKEANAVASELIGQGEGRILNPEIKLNTLKKFIQKGIDLGKKSVENFSQDLKNHSTGFFGKALGEGLEEVSEELVTDLSKQLYQIAGEFSPNFINLSGITDVGAWENAKERYLMSLLGGTLGGGMFYGVEVFKGKNFKRDTSKDELIYLISNNKTQEVLKELDKWKSSGKFGSKTLSASKYELDSQGNPVFLTAENEEDSQNTFIYNRIKESVLLLEHALKYTNTNLSEDDLFKQMVLQEQRFLNLKEYLLDLSYVTKYLENFRIMTRDLLNAETSLNLAYKTEDGTPEGKLLTDSPSAQILNNPERLKNIKDLEEKVKQLREKRDNFLSGEQSLPYLDKLLVAIDPYLRENLISMTYDEWLKANKNKTVDQLSSAEKESFKTEYLTYKENKQALDLDQIYKLYKNIGKLVNPHIFKLAESADLFRKNSEVLNKLFIEGNPFEDFNELTEDDQIDWEFEEEYNNINKNFSELTEEELLEWKSEEDFNNRKNELKDLRKLKIFKYNNNLRILLKDKILKIIKDAGDFIDPSTLRHLYNKFDVRISDIANDIINAFIKVRLDLVNKNKDEISKRESDMYEVMKKIKPDFSNYEQIREELEKMITNPIRLEVKKRNSLLEEVLPGFKAMFDTFGYEYDEDNITGETVLDFIDLIADKIITKDLNIIDKFEEIGRSNFLSELQNKTKDKIIEKLLEFDPNEESLLEAFFGTEIDEDFELEEVDSEVFEAIKTSITKEKDNYNMFIYSDEEIDEIVNDRARNNLNWINNTLMSLKETVEVDPFVELLTELLKRVTETNPVVLLMKLLNIAIDPKNRNIEEILNGLYLKSLNLNSKSEFTLKPQDEQTLDDISTLLGMVQSYLYASSSGFDFSFPVGHNSVINDFAKNHKDVIKDFEELPTLDNDVANMYILEIQKYLNELDINIPTSWRALSNKNRANKRQRLITTDTNYNKAKLELFNVLTKATSKPLRFTYDDKDYDLSEGFDSILDDDETVKLHKLENLFYVNLHKILNKGISFKDILKNTHILESLSKDENLSEIVRQQTSELDETINYGKLTYFDKFMYLMTISGISSNEFNKFIKDSIEALENEKEEDKKIPLTILEYTSRLAMAHIKSRDLFNLAFEYLQETLGSEVRPFLTNLLFIDGSAGVGKTTVIAKNASNYVNSDDILLLAPKKTQLDTLLKIIGKGDGKLREDFFNLILDPTTYQKIKDQLLSEEINKTLIDSKKIGEGTNNTTEVLINLDQYKFKDLDNVPKLIIVDEITHFSGIELLILNEFAKRNNISIIGLGDTILNGFTGTSRNVNRELVITFRSPRLSITLRDVNLLKLDNLISVAHIARSMSNLDKDKDPNYNQKMIELIKLAKKLNLQVYNQDEVNGDLITEKLTEQQVKKLYGEVAFVGDTNKEAYKTLVDNYDSNKITVLEPKEIQGLEFDFIIVDLNFVNPENYPARWFEFLTNLYTLMSRGKVGSIFIDNNLSNIIGKNTISQIKEKAPNLKDAIEPFIEARLEGLEKLNLISNKEFDKLLDETSEVEEKTEDEENNNENENLNNEDDDNNEENNNNEVEPGTTDDSLTEDDNYKSDEEAEKDEKKMHEIIGDKLYDLDEDDINKLIQLDPDFPIRVYGSAHFSGLIKEKVESKAPNSKGSTTYWHKPKDITVKEDLLIFMDKDMVVDDEITSLVDSLLNLKSVILYGNDLKTLHSSVTSVVDANHLKDIVFKLEVRPRKDTDNFVGLTGLQEDGTEGNRPDINGLVYTLVAEFKNNKEENCKITLGLLANPTSFLNYAVGTSEEAEVASKINKYKTLFKNITELYELEGLFSLEITPYFSGLTNIRKYTGVKESKKPVEILSLDKFRKTHPHTIISDPYVFVGDNFKGYNKIDALRGRAVVFVSNDTTLKPEDLMSLYIELKEISNKEPNSNLFNLKGTKPKVRMLMLSPKGVSFKSLTYLKKLYTTVQTVKGEKFIKLLPFEEDYMGIRMYTSLWNYRANLTRFLDEYDSFLKKTGYSDEDVLRISLYADAIYKKNNSEDSDFNESVEYILSSTSATQEEIDNINKFNDSLAYSVRQFRLGGSRKKSGMYLRNLSNITLDNAYYKDVKEIPIGIYITPQAAKKLLNLINAILNETFGSFINLKWNKNGKEENWPITRLISPKDNYKNSLSGLVSQILSSDDSLVITENGEEFELKFPSNTKSVFTLVPVVLQKIYSEINKYQTDGEDMDSNNIRIGKKGNYKYFSYSELLKQIELGYTQDEDGEEIFDSSLDELFALAFHGTTANLETSTMRATDAYFKNGLYVDPMGAEVVGTTSTGTALFKRLLTNESLFTVDADVDMPIFTIKLNLIEKALIDSKTPTNTLDEIIPIELRNLWKAITPEDIIDDINELFSTSTSKEKFELEATKIINEYYQTNVINSIKNNKSPENILNSSWFVDSKTMTTQTVLLYLENLYGKSLIGYTDSHIEENIITLTLADGHTVLDIKFNSFNNNFEISENIANFNSDRNLIETIKSEINKYLNDNVSNNSELMDIIEDNEIFKQIYNELQELNYENIEQLENAMNDYIINAIESNEMSDVLEYINNIIINKKCK